MTTLDLMNTYQPRFRYNKADADLNLSRAEVEKQRVNSTIKSQQCDDSKNEYANQLQKTNDQQVNNNHTKSYKTELSITDICCANCTER